MAMRSVSSTRKKVRAFVKHYGTSYPTKQTLHSFGNFDSRTRVTGKSKSLLTRRELARRLWDAKKAKKI